MIVLITILFFLNPLYAQVTGELPSPDLIEEGLQENTSSEHLIMNKISEAFTELLLVSEDSSKIDCGIQRVKNGVGEAGFLWEDLAKINGALIDKVFHNFDKFLAFIKYFHPERNDPSMVGSGLYALKVFADLAVSNDEETSVLDRESLVSLLDIVKNEPFNMEILPGVDELISKIDYIEISKVKRGKLKGQTQIVIHNEDDDDIEVGIEKFLGRHAAGGPVKDVLLEDKAKITFLNNNVSKGKGRDKRIVDLLDDVKVVENEEKAKIVNSRVERVHKFLSFESEEPGRALNGLVATIYNLGDQDSRELGAQMTELYHMSGDDPEVKDMAMRDIVNKITGKTDLEETSSIELNEEANSSVEQYNEKVRLFVTRAKEAIVNKEKNVLLMFDESDRERAKDFVSEKKYDESVPPIFFQARGLKATLSGSVGNFSDVQLREGAVLPKFSRSDKQITNSVFISGSGTGLVGSFLSETMPL